MRALVITHALTAFAPAVDLDIALALADAVQSAGHRTEVVRLPFDPTEDGIRAVAGVRMVDYSGMADLAVCLSPVGSLVRHHRKVAWFDSVPGRPLMPDFPALDDRLLAECAMRYVRSGEGLASLRDRDLTGAVLAVPTDATSWARAAKKVTD